jgi:hypothetical protein
MGEQTTNGNSISTMMAEYITLSTAMHALIPIKFMVVKVGELMGLNDSKLAMIKAKTLVHEDNNSALTLSKIEPTWNMPTSKLFHIKYHWFREQLKPEEICIMKVSMDEQLGNISTKGLCLAMFEVLCCKIMG